MPQTSARANNLTTNFTTQRERKKCVIDADQFSYMGFRARQLIKAIDADKRISSNLLGLKPEAQIPHMYGLF